MQALCVQMPGPPYSADRVGGRIVMVRCGETQNSGHGKLLGTRDEELTILGDVQAQKAAELLMDLQASSAHLLYQICGVKLLQRMTAAGEDERFTILGGRAGREAAKLVIGLQANFINLHQVRATKPARHPH